MAKLKETLFSKYLKERQNGEILENGFGFITYRINGKECFIIDMCIDPQTRGLGQGKLLIEQLVKIAKAAGCEVLTANVYPQDPNHTNTLSAAFKTGFVVTVAHNGVLIITRKLEA